MGLLGSSVQGAAAATTASWQHFLQLKLVEHTILEDLWGPIREEAAGSSCSLGTSQTHCGPGLTTCPPRILLWIPCVCHKPQPGIMALARLADGPDLALAADLTHRTVATHPHCTGGPTTRGWGKNCAEGWEGGCSLHRAGPAGIDAG